MRSYKKVKDLLQRREERKEQSFPVRVWGMDEDNKAFAQSAFTYDVSSNGARLGSVRRWKTPGDMIQLSCGAEVARFKVVWIGTDDTPFKGQVGVRLLDRGKAIWEVRDGLRNLASSSEQNGSKADQERRRQYRYSCYGGIHIRQTGTNTGVFGKLTQVSLGGCYIQTANPFPQGTIVELEAGANHTQFAAVGVVKVVIPGAGMGVEFNTVLPEFVEGLKLLIISLEESQRPKSESASA